MLEHLEIKNFALIENLCVDFSDGFNVITGETGSGKSIILGALGLLMGEKADSGSIRNGCDEVSVNALISIPEKHEINSWLNERGIETEDGQVLLKRTVKTNGRSVISIQGQLITKAELVFFADSVIDMHGQSEHQSLLDNDKQRKVVDSFAKNSELLESCRVSSEKIKELETKERELIEQTEETKRQEDYLRFASDEIKSAGLKEGEEEELKNQVQILSQFETIFESINSSTENLRQADMLFKNSLNSMKKAAG